MDAVLVFVQFFLQLIFPPAIHFSFPPTLVFDFSTEIDKNKIKNDPQDANLVLPNQKAPNNWPHG